VAFPVFVGGLFFSSSAVWFATGERWPSCFWFAPEDEVFFFGWFFWKVFRVEQVFGDGRGFLMSGRSGDVLSACLLFNKLFPSLLVILVWH